jgi:hypothetical protein
MKNLITVLSIILLFQGLHAQKDSSGIRRTPQDTARSKMNLDAVYNRPFLQAGKLPVAIGGYLETNTSYFSTNGISEGFSFQFPRLTLFMSSSISQRIKFLTEIEFEEGGREINIEFASLDFQLHPLLNVRAGIIMNPIGAFNQNHDGPKWEFVSRPLSATTIIPSTLSNAGMGVFGKYGLGKLVWAYEAYLSNGFNDRVILNSENRTWLPAAKNDPERFEESFNGEPLATVKTAVKHYDIGELGISWMGGVYNKFMEDGLILDKRRRLDLLALDFNSALRRSGTYINAEWVWAMVDVPLTYSQQFGSRQRGGFLDIVQPVMRGNIFGWENSTLNIALRSEYVDYNAGNFRETGTNIFDHVYALVPGVSFRPSRQTVVRLNYRYQWQTDILGNPAARTAGIQFGFSSYF